MSWLTVALGCLAMAAVAAWVAERARRRRGESAILRREAASAAAARAARDEAEARFRAALHDAGVGLVEVDARGALLDCNEALARQLGGTRPALLGRPLADALQPGDRESFQVALGALVRGERDREAAERTFRRPDGESRRLRCTLAALRDEAGGFRSAIGLLEDVTERAALQGRLADADRLAALGALAGGVAHELADPMAYVIGNLSYARELLAGGARPDALAQARQALDEAHQGAARVGQVVGDLRALARPGTGRPEAVDAAAAVRAAARLAEGSLRGRARVALEVLPAPAVLGDPARLGQALLGLLHDAVRALPPGQEAEHLVRIALAPTADGRVRVGVSVHGPGLGHDGDRPAPPDPGQAAALDREGLAAARRALEAMGGELTVTAAPGLRAATAHLPVAPRADRLSPAGPAPEAAGAGQGPRGRVLVVDDEPYVGKTLRRILGQAHDVEVVASGEAALARLAAGPAPDVILCDLMMPGMTGMALHAELAARAPAAAARMVFVTGGAVQEEPRRFLERVANPVLEKPLAPEVLRRVVAECVRLGVAALPPDLATPSI